MTAHDIAALRRSLAPVLVRIATRQQELGRALTAAEVMALVGAVSWSRAVASSAGDVPPGSGSARP
jgi:hypothetical protein